MYLVEQLAEKGNKLVYKTLFITEVLKEEEKFDGKVQVNLLYDLSEVEADENNLVSLFRITELKDVQNN